VSLRIKVWGCRGSIACPTPTHLRYGGNTTSLEVDAGDKKFILDCGTGVRNLGQELLKKGARDGTLLLTHTHWDHINGFPFFRPAFEPDRSYHILAGHLYDKQGIKAVFETQMDNPMFPVPLEAMKAKLSFEDFQAGDSLDLGQGGGLKVKTCKLNHPNDATGYRIEHGGKAFCLITDTEHVPGQPDQNILDLIEGADLVFYDSTYTEEEFPSRVGWGHSTWEEGVALCKAANVKKLGIFHHDPEHDDLFMDHLAAKAKATWPNAFVVREQLDLIID
jgi:phosphoribosyl 1,2-cyclic phosphodiesterase